MDSAVAFDTLAAARALEAAGMERRQAEAVAEVTASARADQGELATKADIARLETRMARQEARIYLAMAGLWAATVAAIAGMLAVMLPS